MMIHLLALKAYFIYAAVAGGILMFCCRRRIRAEAIETSEYWTKAFRIIPFAEMFFAASHWGRPKMRLTAALWIFGFLCCLPFALDKLESLEREDALKSSTEALPAGGPAALAKLERGALDSIAFSQRKTRFDKLNELLAPWYEEMNARRNALTGAPRETIEAFNVEAAAYTELRQFTNVEFQAIAAWESRVQAEQATAADEADEG